jgi:hypothetical protein
MNLKSIILTLTIASLGVSASFETASAGKRSIQMSGRVIDYVGCPAQRRRAVKAMQKHPERWGKPSASLLAQYPELQRK